MVDLLPRFIKEGIDVALCLFYGKKPVFTSKLNLKG